MKRLALAGLTGLGLLALLVMVATTLLAVAARFLDLAGLEWSYEVAGLAFVWTTFLGAALAEARRENAAFEVVRARLPRAWQAGLERFGALLLLIVGGALVASGLAALSRSGWVPTPLLRWPGGVQTAAAPLLGASLCLIALQRLLRRGAAAEPGPVTALPDDATGLPL
ncbi:TRAP transporter small permease [Lichenibacterium ramalinae]|uniref:TRAP transporter small permease protein n=1 Tax=Lichenibacterium ramalinae TaxID=2316527 RepID=A0A4Q2RLV9_9HYPH|nr:TRAP transporter small permease [Lichenibacterium ramalinae]RYB07841.1 TRAP transporter small permease [Lichenibacterium ramalinae]